MVSADEPLAAGVVDALLAQGTRRGRSDAGGRGDRVEQGVRPLAAGGGRARGLADAARRHTPARGRRRRSSPSARRPVAVKPAGLTGGKGVKVMGPHLASHEEARDYALSLLAAAGAGESVLIEEKILGAEFTIQAISDGRTVVFPPATYDYPVPLRRRRGAGHGRHGLALDGRADPALHDDAPTTSRRARSSSGDRASRRSRDGISRG